MSWCGYIDILGTKALADHALDELRDHLEWFHTSLLDNFVDNYEGRCVAASDGAFFENELKDQFYPYYQRVRNFLIDKGVYFKCSYVPGKIDFMREQIESEIPEDEPRFLSLNFSSQASQAYRAEARLKGIGCSIEGNEIAKGDFPENLITNFYLDREGSKYTTRKFLDFSFSSFEIGSVKDVNPDWPTEQPLLERIFYHTSLASMDSEYIASKYVPLFINAIRSSDFTNVSAKENRWEVAPLILSRIVSSKSALKGFPRLPGTKYIVLALYDEFYRQNNGEFQEMAESKVVRFIANRRDCQSNLNDVPHYVLSTKAKNSLIRKLARNRGIGSEN